MFALAAVPNKINVTIIGPMVVPKEFTPPARFNRCEPVLGSPRSSANGFAAVCCKENPSPTINNEPKTKPKADESPVSAPVTAIIIAPAPKADRIKP